LTFGQSVYTSQILAAAQNVAGVDSVSIAVIKRVDGTARDGGDPHTPDTDTEAALAAGALGIGPFEIARLDNDANHPERGFLTIDLRGGR